MKNKLFGFVREGTHHTPGYLPQAGGYAEIRIPPPFAPPLQSRIICPWRKQINPGDHAPSDSDSLCGGSPTACRHSMGSTKRRRNWRGSTAGTASRTGRVTGRISNLNGSECLANGRGGFGGSSSTAKFPMAGHRPIPTTRIRGSIPSAHWRPGYRRNTGCFGRCCSTVGLRTDGRLRLNSATLKCLSRRTGSGIQTSAYQDHAPIRTNGICLIWFWWHTSAT